MSMKHLSLLLAVLLVGAVTLAGLVLARAKPAADCTSRVVISRGPHGQSVECVCLEGRLSTCFDPGP